MDPLKYNKYMAGLLIALLAALISTIIAESLVDPEFLPRNIYTPLVVDRSQLQGSELKKPKEVASIAELMAEANSVQGKKIAHKKCAQCHTFDQGGKNRIGPNLWGIVNTEIGKKPGFTFSKAMMKKEGKWTVEILNKYLYKPRVHIPGTKMSFAGLKDEKDRADVIKYLKSLK